jgi:hypothetical protein
MVVKPQDGAWGYVVVQTNGLDGEEFCELLRDLAVDEDHLDNFYWPSYQEYEEPGGFVEVYGDSIPWLIVVMEEDYESILNVFVQVVVKLAERLTVAAGVPFTEETEQDRASLVGEIFTIYHEYSYSLGDAL